MRSGKLYMIHSLWNKVTKTALRPPRLKVKVADLIDKLARCKVLSLSNKHKHNKSKTDTTIYWPRLPVLLIYLICKKRRIPDECTLALTQTKRLECLAIEFSLTNRIVLRTCLHLRLANCTNLFTNLRLTYCKNWPRDMNKCQSITLCRKLSYQCILRPIQMLTIKKKIKRMKR
jgi:hypothetical protein